jgi:hypothetical protein
MFFAFEKLQRPLILKENRIDLLSNLIKALQATSPEFIKATDRLLHDAQSRLAFRAEQFMTSQINQFKVNPQELLLFARTNALPKPAPVDSVVDMNQLFNVQTPLNDQVMGVQGLGGGEFYPPCQKTVYLLQKLFLVVPVIRSNEGRDFSRHCPGSAPKLS